MNFEYFKAVCEDLAKSIHCIFEAKNFSDYGWFQGCFMTDRFGGVASIVKFHNGNWSNNDFCFGSLSEALANVPKQVKEMEEARVSVDFFENYD